MIITFISNYLTLHQIPFCEAMYRELGDSFRFVNTEQMEAERISMGWKNEKRYPFEIDIQQAGNLIDESDIVIIGSANESLIQCRLKSNKPVIRYSERILKNGRWHMLSPRAIKNMFRAHTRFTNNRIWLLCASAYAAGDYGLFGAYWGKCHKWGYFPKTKKYDDIEKIIELKHPDSILWVARLIEWKHPELPVLVAEKLRDEGYSFELNMIGNGVMEEQLNEMIEGNDLKEYVHLLGSMKPGEVRAYMEQSQIFLFTSDGNEGWGAVLNESMNSACAVVASHAIGSVPFLIKDKENGLIYEDGNIEDLYSKVKLLLDNNQYARTLGKNAYKTIVTEWNAEVAAKRLTAFCKAIKNQKKIPEYQKGPMSKAGFLSNHWYRKKTRLVNNG